MTARVVLPVVAALITGCSSSGVVVGGPGPTPVPAPGPAPQQVRGNSESVHVLGVPPGHLPHAGQCRVWVPGTPPGHQARSRSCYGIAQTAPLGSWILYRPGSNSNIIHVHQMDRTRVGVIVVVQVFDVSGRYLRDEPLNDHRDDEDDYRDKQQKGHGQRQGHNEGRPGR